MDEETFRELLMKLRDLICLAYTDAKFAELMFVRMPAFDYAGLPAMAFEDKVFKTVVWANQYGQMPFVLRLARIVRDARPQHPDLKTLVDRLEQAVNPGPQAADAPGGISPESQLPPDLIGSLALLEAKLRDLVFDLRPKLRARSYAVYNLPLQFHLSDSEGRRLAAVLALEAEPDAAYLRWLAERVAVENPFVAFTAAQALTTAALKIPGADLERVRRALVDAADRLDGLVEPEDQLALGFDSGARKRQLQTAATLLEMRSKQGRARIPPGTLDQFVECLMKTFDQGALERLCRNRLHTDLRFVANPDDPFELIVVNLLVTARDRNWERDLICAVYAESQVVFADFRKYADDCAAVA
jgi:hypothetical protein